MIQKTEEATGDLVGNKLVDKVKIIKKLECIFLKMWEYQNKDTYLQKRSSKLLMNLN